MYDSTKFVHESDITISPETHKLVDQANEVYKANFDGKTWYGRCIFFSWYCKKGDCKFCYRSTMSHKIRHAKPQHRSYGSMLLEALFCKVFNWRIEFLTGGYQEDHDFKNIVDYARVVSAVYGEKIWVNIGWMNEDQIELLRPFVKGICASIETPTPGLHDFVCPQKPIAPYEKMFEKAVGFKRSAAFIIGLGDTDEDISYWIEFITKHKLDRITLYALKPIRNGHYTEAPSHDMYLSWIARLRIAFPKLEIIGGTNLRRCEETGLMIKAGVNALTKFPATKQFGTKKAQILVNQIQAQEREFISNLLTVPETDWIALIDALEIEQEHKDDMKKQLSVYVTKLENPRDLDPAYREE